MNQPSAQAVAIDAEVRKFDALAHEFWDARGAFQALHTLNPVRLDYVAARAKLAQQRVLDVGCGGGLLAEALSRSGAIVTGIDLAPAMIEVARLHAHESQLRIDYRLLSAEQLAQRCEQPFDVITCMEMIEHVPDPAGLLLAIARLLRPGGQLFLSTINRNLRSFLLAIVGAEYVLKLLPRGTHEYARLLRPSELARHARAANLSLRDVRGIEFNPFLRSARLTGDTGVNYLAHFESEAELK
ncbi:MAG TPA: bifunctional 2-polyprenyl-6-hydroxyphenol methylase/3-demethylubiquinol 3-O-methyltransferase UbiG [Steroidobacteraceae bacterium]|nr:bifunctional 2-polyprenyl-6-hydroxyphenol methylase/3-demethylubiquinol 3-O-methyltransferase UbiG [Steroidobacteraceae bacterium]